ncbi:MAG TPA: hypothetical protein VGR18_07290 [Rubrobacter sp.]|nr:hypothetical protein [Rubrobacter sp.]
MPTICNECGRFFSADQFFHLPGIIDFNEVEVGPCPYCGGMGHIPDGTYNFVGDVTQVLQAPQRTYDELRKLAYVLSEAQERGADAEEIIADIERETPELASITDLLPRNRAEWYAFIALILTVIQLLMSAPSRVQDVNVDADVVINKTVEQTHQTEPQCTPVVYGRGEIDRRR